MPASLRSTSHTILLIEDERIMRDMFALLLERDDRFDLVGAAGTAREGMEMWRRLSPDLTLVDFALPDATGLQLVARMKEARPEARVVILSGHHDPAIIAQVRDSSADGYILKGDPQDILSASERVLSGERVFTLPLL